MNIFDIFTLEPQEVEKISTPNREIKTKIPVPESIEILKELRKYEPLSMTGQPPIVWDRAEGVNVYDAYGNKWLDWSSGVLVANAGHSNPYILNAIKEQVDKKLIHNYCFPNEIRLKLAKKLIEITPEKLNKVFILTTGSEAVEAALKMSRKWAKNISSDKNIIISFEGAFHGRTLGAQMVGGIPALKEWIPALDPYIYQVPFPDGYWTENTDFSLFEEKLNEYNIDSSKVAAVIVESYQGGGASFAPEEYMKKLREWCNKNNVILIFDEVQASFGRSGKLFSYEHYGVEPDLLTLGKGISSGLPVSAVVGREDIMNVFPPNAMTSTHTGNPVTNASAIANIEYILNNNIIEKAAEVGEYLHSELNNLKEKYPSVIGTVQGKGMVAGVHIIKNGQKEPDKELAFRIVRKCYEKGLLMFAPVGKATIKISPPLITTKEQIKEGVSVLDEAINECI